MRDTNATKELKSFSTLPDHDRAAHHVSVCSCADSQHAQYRPRANTLTLNINVTGLSCSLMHLQLTWDTQRAWCSHCPISEWSSFSSAVMTRRRTSLTLWGCRVSQCLLHVTAAHTLCFGSPCSFEQVFSLMEIIQISHRRHLNDDQLHSILFPLIII